MSTKTQNDIVTRALRRIRRIASNETPAPDIYQEALDEYLTFHEWLRKEFGSQVSWNSDAVPDRYWTYVAGWFANDLASVIPVSEADKANAREGAAQAETRLREMLARKKLRTTEADYF